ncbi:MAG: DUF3253 domain-containing protein [Verrucomicrobiota bacterium]
MREPDNALVNAIRVLLAKRGAGKTICPSEAARVAYPQDWRHHLEATRQAALALRDRGEIDICQGGKPVKRNCFSGPIRLRKTN